MNATTVLTHWKVSKDSAEVIELGWVMLDAKKCEEVCQNSPVPQEEAHAKSQMHRESVLVKPVNTPITPLCSKSYGKTAL